MKTESLCPPGLVLTAEQMNALQYSQAGIYHREVGQGWEVKRDAALGIASLASTTDSVQLVPKEVDPHTASSLLQAAGDTLKQRGVQFDKPEGERSMAATVIAFNAITRQNLTESHGWLLMSLLKMVRDNQRETPHEDSCLDLISYASLYAESRLSSLK